MQEKTAGGTPAAPLKLDVSVRVIEPVKNLMGFASVKFNDCFVVEKENKRLGFEINKVNEILRSMSKESQIEFFKAKKEIEKENIEIEKEKNKSYEMRL